MTTLGKVIEVDEIAALEQLRLMNCLAYFKNDNDCGSDFNYTNCESCKHFKFCQANHIINTLLDRMEKEVNKPE